MKRRLLILGLIAVAEFAQIHTAAAQSSPPPFPRVGAYLIGGSINFASVPHIQDMQMAIFSNYPGYSVGGKNMQQQVAAVKAMNPNIKITSYVKINSMVPGSGGGAYSGEFNADNSNNWWLRTTWPSGGIVTTFGGSEYDMNITVPAFRQWMAQYFVGWTTGVAPNLDGYFTDNFYYAPREAGDYLQDGGTQSNTNSTTQQNWRNAYVDWDTQLRTKAGSQYMHWGNVADWNGGSIQGYNQLLNGGVIEEPMAVESYSGWAAMMGLYKIVMNNLAPFNGQGPYALFQQVDSNAGDYQGMRYGLGSALLDNGYYYFTNGGYNTITWFDELGQNLGQPTTGPNNPTNGTYSNGGLTVWKQGVWRRDFTNGIVLVNPKGNGAQTVTLETTYKHFSGTQAPSVNNGQSVTTVTLNDRDGVILLRTATQPVPDAPTLSVQ